MGQDRRKQEPVVTCTGMLTCSLSVGGASGGVQGIRGLCGARQGLQRETSHRKGLSDQGTHLPGIPPLTQLTLLVTGP